MSSGNIDSKSLINIFGGDKRRTSQASAQPASPSNFGGLHAQKRGSLDGAAQARRSSVHEQYAPKGFIGSMWQSFTKGK